MDMVRVENITSTIVHIAIADKIFLYNKEDNQLIFRINIYFVNSLFHTAKLCGLQA